MMIRVARIAPIVKLNLRIRCYGQVYVIIVMRTYFLKELQQSQTRKPQIQCQITELKK